ncbi:phospholipid carrier-dependent glycosyltransferase [Aeromicrobium flavum]|uniref:Polyprenol-phosphate-mannose--protein mannosyltransferase n=1 Tax=Aeromicrobium flavum TaxID=416568 RepID=A0A512HWG5_9ACTN|nr:phospholipid carrier-dependent glycosyltransferase [Aeromicrobium flavum]GEO89784.1 phospholipid carrier-dependent glycosyltransferase [Aeromicrobium flavum]
MTLLDKISLRAWGWIGPIAVALLAFVLRLWKVGSPNSLTFDETYYAKDAWGLIHGGYARDGVDGANERIIKGETDVFTQDPTWIVHPDGGKWLIAAGEGLFGLNPLGWRFPAVVVGSLMVLVLARLVLRLTGSLALGCLAGLLLTLDGLHFTMSRIALLDIYLAFWVLCAVACLAADRDWLGERLAVDDRYRAWRPWQLAAGACFGMAVATKWSGLYVLAAFGVTVVIWEVWARGRITSPREAITRVLRVGLPAFGWLVGVALVVYLLTWTGWLLNHDVFEARFGHGYGDEPVWGSVSDPTGGPLGGVIDAFRSLWGFHQMTYAFHTGEYLASKSHPYESNAFGWLIQWRPTNVSSNFDMAADVCGAREGSKCVRQVLTLGNPALWWVGTIGLITALVAWIRNPTWRWSLPLVGVLATWAPWWITSGRPIFTFYAVAIVPFMIIALCLVLAAIRRRIPDRFWWWGVSAFVGIVIAAFWYWYPLLSNRIITHDQWHERIWWDRWI